MTVAVALAVVRVDRRCRRHRPRGNRYPRRRRGARCTAVSVGTRPCDGNHPPGHSNKIDTVVVLSSHGGIDRCMPHVLVRLSVVWRRLFSPPSSFVVFPLSSAAPSVISLMYVCVCVCVFALCCVRRLFPVCPSLGFVFCTFFWLFPLKRRRGRRGFTGTPTVTWNLLVPDLSVRLAPETPSSSALLTPVPDVSHRTPVPDVSHRTQCCRRSRMSVLCSLFYSLPSHLSLHLSPH